MNVSGKHLPVRHSLRLKNYDYSQPGFYFLTLCVQHRLNLFGNFFETDLELNDAGKMVERWYFEMQNKYSNICCHEMVVMPNHFHCIIEITDAHVGAPLRGRPDIVPAPESTKNAYGPDNKKYNATIGDMVDWFKTMTTNEYIRGVKNHGWQRFNGKLWQRNYWEHIIRNEAELAKIANYIITNPDNWDKDQLKE
jgi:REP element-mobilizing transposase RayT